MPLTESIGGRRFAPPVHCAEACGLTAQTTKPASVPAGSLPQVPVAPIEATLGHSQHGAHMFAGRLADTCMKCSRSSGPEECQPSATTSSGRFCRFAPPVHRAEACGLTGQTTKPASVPAGSLPQVHAAPAEAT
ncbi:hypothetical protein OEZ86_002025 [Tetradesmus obliquus]|nr:hypothetical protein OEZ86_002025 [Tetradesmus obliquus]